MRKFTRRRGVITTSLSSYEVSLLGSLVAQLMELVAEGEPEKYLGEPGGDLFDELVRDLDVSAQPPKEPEDPVLRRLFPTAYPEDPAAAADFRRFTERGLRSKKLTEASTVLAALAQTEDGAHPLRIPPEDTDAWLRTLTSVRLAVATRLGITDSATAEELSDLPENDPRAFMASVYDWLGFAEETLISAL